MNIRNVTEKDLIRALSTPCATLVCADRAVTNATITRSNDRCPEGWTVVNTDA